MALHKRVYNIQDQYATDTKVESSYGAKEAHVRQLPGGKCIVTQKPRGMWKFVEREPDNKINVLLLTDSTIGELWGQLNSVLIHIMCVECRCYMVFSLCLEHPRQCRLPLSGQRLSCHEMLHLRCN